MATGTSLPLHECRILTTNIIINWAHMILTGAALLALFYYRTTSLFRILQTGETPLIPYLIVFLSEIVLTFFWILRRPGRFKPVKRSVYPERLPEDEKLPPVDVFICTADPGKEPALGVMNTVISALSLDYPPDKLAVYLQDDGGSYVTQQAMRDSWKFAKWWVPFCRKYGLSLRCPDAYLSGSGNDPERFVNSSEFIADQKEIQKRYEEFQADLEKNSVNAAKSLSRDHPPIVEVMNGTDPQEDMPLLVYVSREKRPSHPHHFKGGALNALLRISSVISNAPYFLVLDCDHFCKDPTSARQAMCFYLDSKISHKLAWVQFPQRFHNLGKEDIYGGGLNSVYREGIGHDGLRGPSIYGCNFYMSREAIYGMKKIEKDVDLSKLKKSFGDSNELIKSLYKGYNPNVSRDGKVSESLAKEIQLLASCTFDVDTEWGNEVGYAYFTVVEDSITALELHIKGWISVFLDNTCFLGGTTTSLNDMLVQQTRWSFGLMQIALSKYCPLFHGILEMGIPQAFGYCALTLEALYVIPFYGLALIPQICVLHGIPLYPKVSDPFFGVFAFLFLSAHLKYVQEIYSYGDSFMAPLHELRVWMIKSAVCYFYATLNGILDRLGMREANFSLTNKAVDDEQENLFKKGLYNFQVSPLLIIPCCILYIFNLAAVVIGIVKMVRSNMFDEMFVQVFLPLFGIIVNYHFLEGMVLRSDKGRISPSIVLLSAAIAVVILSFGFLFL